MLLIGNLLFPDPDNEGQRSTHPLDLPREKHRQKEIELEEKQRELREKKEQLTDKLESKQDAFEEAEDSERAKQLKRDGEHIKNKIETIDAKLNTVDQMLITVRNFLNVYELRELQEDEYWETFSEMDREDIIEAMSTEKLELEDLISQVETGAVAAYDVVDSFSTNQEELHGTSDLGWEEEYQQRGRTSDENVTKGDKEESINELDEDDFEELRLG